MYNRLKTMNEIAKQSERERETEQCTANGNISNDKYTMLHLVIVAKTIRAKDNGKSMQYRYFLRLFNYLCIAIR